MREDKNRHMYTWMKWAGDISAEDRAIGSLCVFVDVTACGSDSELPRDQSDHQSRHLFDKRESCSLRSCTVILRSIVCTHATSTQDALVAHHISAFNDAND